MALHTRTLVCAPSIWAKHPESFRRASGELPESFRKDGPVIDHTPSPRVAGPCSAVGTCLRQTALKPELTALRGLHAYGKQPMRELETHRFPVLVHAMPQLAADECDSEELPAGHEASDKDWRVQVHTLCIRVAEFQACVKSHRPALPISDVMRDESFKRRTRSALLPSLDAARRAQLAAMGEPFKTVDDETLSRALRGEIMPEGIARPSGAGATSVGVVERGPLHGVSLLVSAPRRLQPLEEGRISWGEHGGFTVEPKAPKCKTMVEWSRGFLRVVREAPEPEREGLLDFLEWGKTIAEEFSFHHFTEFYEHLVRKDQRAGSSVSINEYDAVWRVYAKQYGVRLRRPKPHRWNKYLRDKDRSATTGGGKGQKGGNGKGGKGGKGGQVPLLTRRAHCIAAAFRGWHDVEFLVMRRLIEEDSAAGRIFLADWRLPLGVIALGMVEKVRKGKVKYRPVSDYSRPKVGGVNARIALEPDEYSTVKDAYALLRPEYFMVKVDLENAYRSLGVASMFWPSQCFGFDVERYMDTRAPFGNRALPGIFTRFTRAIVAWMQARGMPCVGYLNDFFCVGRMRAEAEEHMMRLVEFVSFLGFCVITEKCEGPTRRIEFLGVLLSTEGEVCTAAIDEDRAEHVLARGRELRAQAARGMVRRKALESLLGLLAFCSQMVWGLSLYTMRGFAFLAATTARRTVVLHRWEVDERHFATDASGELGFGVCGKSCFSYSAGQIWHACRTSRGSPGSRGWRRLGVWWAVALWGHRMPGTTVVVNIDNTAAMFQVSRWWGPGAYLPLRKQIFYVCSKHNIRLQPVYIKLKDNLLADLLSRLQLDQFRQKHRVFLRGTVWRQDRDDWMVGPVHWVDLNIEFGPFIVDACVAPSRANSYCYRSWSRVEDAWVQLFDGLNAWGNIPFSIMKEILVNFLHAKKRQHWGTAACFLVPVWPGDPGWDMVESMPEGVGADDLVQELHREVGRYRDEALAHHTRRSYGAESGGYRRCWGRPSKPVMPLTLAALAKMAALGGCVDGSLTQCSWWATIPVGFFDLFRKDNLATGKTGARNTRGALVRDDILFQEDGQVVWIRMRHSKTIQCGERQHWVPLRAVPGSPLCPVRALQRLFERTAGRPGSSPLFVMEKVTSRKVTVVTMTHEVLMAGIKALAQRWG
eukprot:gene7899-biopygen7974